MASVDERNRAETNGEQSEEVRQAAELAKAAEQRLIVHDEGPNANLFDTARFNQCWRVAEAMARSSVIPEHLTHFGPKERREALPFKTVVANCFRIVNQAIRWQMDPFAIVDETYVVGGKLGYQGKLVAAVVNARAGILGRLQYEHSGEASQRKVIVKATFEGEEEPKTVEVVLSKVKTANQMWAKDPDQKLCYTGAIKWARRHCPEVILGVLTDDDLEQIEEQKKRQERVSSIEIPDGDEEELPDPAQVQQQPAKSAATQRKTPIPEESGAEQAEGLKTKNTASEADQPLWAGALSEELRAAENPDAVNCLRREFETKAQTEEEYDLLHDMCDEALKALEQLQ